MAPTDSVPTFLEALVIAELGYVATTVAIEFSILLSYRRVFQIPYVMHATARVAVVVSAWALASVCHNPFIDLRADQLISFSFFSGRQVLIVCLQCIPLQGYWDKFIPAKCWVNSHRDYYLGKSIPDTVTDLCILATPPKPIWQLHTNRIQKVVLTLTCLVGGLDVVIPEWLPNSMRGSGGEGKGGVKR